MIDAHDMQRDGASAVSFELTTFVNDGSYDELVVVRDLAFDASCMHDGLRYRGVVHVAYVPSDRIVGASELARLVEHVASEVPTQEQLAARVGRILGASTSARGTGVVVEAAWLTAGRGAGAARTVTALTGCLRDDPAVRAELLALVGAAAAERL